MLLNRDAQSRTNEITVLKVETVQFVTGLLRIHDIFIDYKSGTLGVVGNALANLAVGRVSRAIKLTTVMTIAIAKRQQSTGFLDIPNRPKFSKEVEELFRSNVVAINRLASGYMALDSIRDVATDGGVPQVLYEQSAIRNWSAKVL